MHKLNFQDNYFDIIIMGWCLAYSNNKVVALNEAKRVLKQDGLIAIGHTFAKKSDKEMISERGYIVGSPNQISNEKELDLLIYNSGLKKFNSILLNGENKLHMEQQNNLRAKFLKHGFIVLKSVFADSKIKEPIDNLRNCQVLMMKYS